jgi:epsin
MQMLYKVDSFEEIVFTIAIYGQISRRMAPNLQGTGFHVQEFNLIQALVLLEFLVKNGSERVVDDARSHIATIKILRNFHFIDDKAKDQGINGTFPPP